MKYRVTDSEGITRSPIEAASMRRDGDWLELTNSAPQMEERKINHPEQPGTADKPYQPARVEVIQVHTGRMVQQPIAIFYKPIAVILVNEEPSNGNDA